MAEKKKEHGILYSIRARMTAGLVALLPFAVTLVAIQLLFRILAGFLGPVVKWVLGEELNPVLNSLISVILLLLLIYLVGLTASNIIGRQLFRWGESLLERIPVVRSVHQAAKQVVQNFRGSGGRSFERVVWVEFPWEGAYTLGFVTGHVDSKKGTYLRVFVPTAPNPTSGFMVMMPEARVKEAKLSVDDALKMIVSGGFVSPDNAQVPE